MDENTSMMEQSDRSVDGGEAGEPVILLPNPGEGGPVDSGDDDDLAGVPVIPLPNPGEGGPVYPGNSGGHQHRPGNNRPGNSGSGSSGSGSSGPSLNLPSIWPIRPGNSSNVNNGSSNNNNNNNNNNNCNNCGNNSGGGSFWPIVGTSKARFLNAAYGYPSFRISVGNTRVVNVLNYASATLYSQFRSGYQAVTVAGPDGYIYIQKSMPFPANGLTTIAIIKTASGMDLMQIPDSCCTSVNGYSSFRVGNLAYNCGPLDVLLSDGRVVFSDVRYKEVTSFKRIRNGTYQFFYADTDQLPMPLSMDIETLDSVWLGMYPAVETFGSLYLNVTGRNFYSVYILQNGSGRNNIQNLILTDQ